MIPAELKSFDLSRHGISHVAVYRNLAPAILYEHSIKLYGGKIVGEGALFVSSLDMPRASDGNRLIVEQPGDNQSQQIGQQLQPISNSVFEQLKEFTLERLTRWERLYVADGFAGPRGDRVRIRGICGLPHQALILHNFLVAPGAEALAEFESPDVTLFFPAGWGDAALANRLIELPRETASIDEDADPPTPGMAINLSSRELLCWDVCYAEALEAAIGCCLSAVGAAAPQAIGDDELSLLPGRVIPWSPQLASTPEIRNGLLRYGSVMVGGDVDRLSREVTAAKAPTGAGGTLYLCRNTKSSDEES